MLGDVGRVVATDLSDEAVEVARFNVRRYDLENKVEIRQGSWFEPLQDLQGQLSGLVSNPPYIPSNHIPGLQAEVGRHEPLLALDGGDNGMDHLLHICQMCFSALKPGGFFAFETNGDEQSEFIVDFINRKWSNFFHDLRIFPDFAGIKRFVTGFCG
ncbi:release factor glutamine methyltransferase [Apostasia shenzhenica]|uniref:Release factor glutamine methyltransferase n=1 Tax=Apostasia shenzhenica TaxID=1088818 RepID=A0A2I0AN70_9ASPA|nr:release factor glutamine methyltransferase [Apostasia shenzhenica]